MKYKVLIPSAGLGTRLGDLSKNINKAMVSVDNKPVISHVIERFPASVEIVVALGYKADLLKDYLLIAHSDRKLTFVNVDPYCGPSSGLGYTILQCQKHLQCPFIFTPNDTLVLENIPLPDKNWMGYAEADSGTHYRTVQVGKDNRIEKIYEKEDGVNTSAYIGLAGIHDYKAFWKIMNEGVNYGSIKIGESYALRSFIKERIPVEAKQFSWYDTGIVKNLEITRKAFAKKDSPHILEKPNEAIWFVNNKAVKYSVDEKFIRDRVERANYIQNYVPQITDTKTNLYAYKLINGATMSRVVTRPLFYNFLQWMKEFWKEKALEDKDAQEFEKKCLAFYYDKTKDRIAQYFARFNSYDSEGVINDVQVPKVFDLLEKVDWKRLSNGQATTFHGDLHFENILVAENGDFYLLDWRQNFADIKEYGDLYYDLAKLLHGLIVPHEMVDKNNFVINQDGGIVSLDILRNHKLVECEKIFKDFVQNAGYDLYKVELLTALIYLNIAALHHYPYSEFLFYLGKYQLFNLLEEGQSNG